MNMKMGIHAYVIGVDGQKLYCGKCGCMERACVLVKEEFKILVKDAADRLPLSIKDKSILGRLL